MSAWFCSHCGQRASYQGHYGQPIFGQKLCVKAGVDNHGWGFMCPAGHRCLTKKEQEAMSTALNFMEID